ncbi:MAG: S8 family serine peptidase [Candidatus Sericytochromatia bacterium]|nr:S8 family serine peptidase [Candidatus Tanganyikabacteria bacterium]
MNLKSRALGLLAVTLVGCGVQTPAVTGMKQDTSLMGARAVFARRLIVGFKDGSTAARSAALVQGAGVASVKKMPRLAMEVFEVQGDLARARQRLASLPGVSFVESELMPEVDIPVQQEAVALPGFRANADSDPNRKDQWYLDTMGIPQIWAEAGNLKTVKVAVVDTGVDLKHPDLQGVLEEGANFAQPGRPPQDGQGHGTMTAGLVGAIANNGKGIAGVAPNSRIVPVKVGNSASSVCEAMLWAADNADMITMSLSFKPNMAEYPTAVQATKRAAEAVMAKGTPMACSMGNTGTTSKNVPSAFAGNEVPDLIAVGATDNKDRVAEFSTRGSWCSVSAPGVNIMTLKMGGGYGTTNGTSFSTPITAGVMALMLGRGIERSPKVLKERLVSTAIDIDAPGQDPNAGAGRVDAYKAVMK